MQITAPPEITLLSSVTAAVPERWHVPAECTFRVSEGRRFRPVHPRGGGFPGSSAGKQSACNAGDPGSIPGSGKSPGDGIGYQLQYSRFSFVTSRLRIHLQCWRPGFDPWTWEDPLEKGKATQARILQSTGVLEYSGLENSRDYTAHGVARVRQD